MTDSLRRACAPIRSTTGITTPAVQPTHDRRPLRVLYFARAPFISGAERALISMLRHLDPARIHPALVLGCQTPFVDQARALGIDVSVAPMPKRSRFHMPSWWQSLRAMTREIEHFAPDVVHANDVPSCQAMSVAAGRLAIPRVVHVRWVISATAAAWWARCGAERLICISQWMRQQLGSTRGTPLESAQTSVLPDAVDWPAQAPDQAVLPSLSTSGPVLGFAGQLIESKGLDLVIEAMGQLPSSDQPQLIVAGRDTQTGGAYQQHLARLAQRCDVTGRIRWLGFLDDITHLYEQVTVMVCPSRTEPLGLVPLEAAQYALPTIASRTGGLAETIEDGVTGVLVEPSVRAWTHAIAATRNAHVMAQMGRAAHDRTKRLYAPKVYQQRLTSLYDELTGSNRQPTGEPTA